MSMIDWAENEVRLACERERDGSPEDEWIYGVECYKSALKAYKSICEDEHSGCSFGITVSILNRLCRGEPLTPIFDTPDIWNELSCKPNEYQCKRAYNLFKTVDDNGNASYHDVDRVLCVNINNENDVYRCGLVSNLMDEIYPIEMPYCQDKFKVYCEEFLADENNGDFDTVGIFYAVDTRCPEKRIEINRFYKESNNDIGFEEISKEEYEARKSQVERLD